MAFLQLIKPILQKNSNLVCELENMKKDLAVELQEIDKEIDRLRIEKAQFAYNIFSLSSRNVQLEDFHNDILHSLLDPAGLHKKGNTFLRLFITFLKDKHNVEIEEKEFSSASIKKNFGDKDSKIDVLIADEESKSAIIIENKINDAVDQDKQLTRYYDYCKDTYTVKAIIYLSLRGNKTPPSNDLDIIPIIVGYYTGDETKNDLVDGWLSFCEDESEDKDTQSLIIQYRKLIRFLGFQSWEKGTYSELYNLANEHGIDKIEEKRPEYIKRLNISRAENYQRNFTEVKPFERLCPKKTSHNYLLFMDYKYEENIIRIEVEFSVIGFWLGIDNRGADNGIALKELVKKIDFTDKMDSYSDGWFHKNLNIGDEYSLLQVDEYAYQFTNDLIKELINHSQEHK